MRRLPIPAVMTVLSAIALGLVMGLHLPTLPKHWLFELGVPWFFFASGFWFGKSSRSYGENLRVRVRTLLVPYYLWNLLWFPVLFACNWFGWRYCGAQRVVDGSLACVLRCLGLSPFDWPALVPTWYLRALFVAVLVVGGVARTLAADAADRKTGGWTVAGIFWAAELTRRWWLPTDALWTEFFAFGVPLSGCAYFATGQAVARHFRSVEMTAVPQWANRLRRQLTPVYVLHAAVIVAGCWAAKALGFFDRLATTEGDVVMWFVGIVGAVAIGETLRRFAPRAANVLFGGR